jgi:hypothetical protein
MKWIDGLKEFNKTKKNWVVPRIWPEKVQQLILK